MLKMIIVAFPQAAAKVIFLKEQELEQEIASYFCWEPELQTQVPELIKQQAEDTSDITLLGPESYVAKIAENLKASVEIPIEIGAM